MKLKHLDWRYWKVIPLIFIYPVWYTIGVRIFPEYHNIAVSLDAAIPFNEWFIIPYMCWFVYLVFFLGTLFFKDKNTFLKTLGFLLFGMGITATIGIVYPNANDLRPTTFENRNIATCLIQLIYAVDPPAMVLPSIHVYNTLGTQLGVCKSRTDTFSGPVRWFAVGFGLLIMAATVFTKQHSIIDVVAALALGALAYPIFYHGAYGRWIDRITSPQK